MNALQPIFDAKECDDSDEEAEMDDRDAKSSLRRTSKDGKRKVKTAASGLLDAQASA